MEVIRKKLIKSLNCFSAEIFKYKDEKTGQIIYSNKPLKEKKVEKIDIPEYSEKERLKNLNSTPQHQPINKNTMANVKPNIPPDLAKALAQIPQNNDVKINPPLTLPPLPAIPQTKTLESHGETDDTKNASNNNQNIDTERKPKTSKEDLQKFTKDPFSAN